jgi:hypothetical protein
MSLPVGDETMITVVGKNDDCVMVDSGGAWQKMERVDQPNPQRLVKKFID